MGFGGICLDFVYVSQQVVDAMSKVLNFAPMLIVVFLVSNFNLHLAAQETDCPAGQTTAENRACAHRHLDEAEAAMKIAFQRALAQFANGPEKPMDAEPLPKSERGDEIAWRRRVRSGLLVSQKAWLAYRESACGSVNDLFYMGTIADEEVTFCKADLTKARTKFIEDYFNSDK